MHKQGQGSLNKWSTVTYGWKQSWGLDNYKCGNGCLIDSNNCISLRILLTFLQSIEFTFQLFKVLYECTVLTVGMIVFMGHSFSCFRLNKKKENNEYVCDIIE